MSVHDSYRYAMTSLQEKMDAAGMVPAAGVYPEFEFAEDTNCMTLSIPCVPRSECSHQSGFVPVNIIENGVVTSVTHCPICKRIV